MTNSYNYKTYYLGTPKDLEESTSLFLLRSEDFKVNLENLSEIEDEIKKSESIKKAWRGEGNIFYLTLGNDLFEFDTIIYNNPISGFVGYTLFSSHQKCYSSSGVSFGKLKISLIFDRIEGEGNGLFIELKTFLNPNTDNTEILGSSERWQYQKSKELVPDENEDLYLRYTNRIPDLLNDGSLGIITESGVMKGDRFYGLNILSGIDIDSSSYSTIKPTFYKGDLVILKYSHQTGEYCVSSMTTLNKFGRPHDYLSGIIENVPEEFIGYNGQALLFSDGDNYVVYSMETSDTLIQPKKTGSTRNCIIIDRWDPEGKIQYIPESDIKEKISRSCQTPTSFSSDLYVYQDKIGKWWVFRNKTEYVYISVYGIIRSNVRIEFINDRLGLYTESGLYHFIPIDLGHTYVYKNGGFIDEITREFSDIKVKPYNRLSSLPIDTRCFLDGLRRKPLRTQSCLPGNNILGVGMGMIFYLSEGNLYCY